MEEKTPRTGPTLVWVDAFKVGDLVAHPKYGAQRYTEPQLLEAIRNFRALAAKGYETTLLREHGREDSYVYGRIHDVRISNDGYFQCLAQFYRVEDREAYNAGILREFSPGFAHKWLDPHSGEEMENVLLELSFTSRAYQRNLRPPQNINPGVVLSDVPTALADTPSGQAALNGDPEMEEEEVVPEAAEEETEEETEFNQESAFSALSAKMDALMDMLKPKEEEPATMSDEVTEVDQLSAQVAELKAELLTAKLSARGIDAERIPTLVALSGTVTAEQFNEVVNYAATPQVPATVIQAEVGATGSADVEGGDATPEAIVEEAKAAGVEYGGGKFSLWVGENYPDRFDEITTFASH